MVCVREVLACDGMNLSRNFSMYLDWWMDQGVWFNVKPRSMEVRGGVQLAMLVLTHRLNTWSEKVLPQCSTKFKVLPQVFNQV